METSPPRAAERSLQTSALETTLYPMNPTVPLHPVHAHKDGIAQERRVFLEFNIERRSLSRTPLLIMARIHCFETLDLSWPQIGIHFTSLLSCQLVSTDLETAN